MAWPGSTTFDTTYHWQKTANFSAFMYAMNNLHKIVDDDGSGVAANVDLVSALPSDNDYYASCTAPGGNPFAQPVTTSVGAIAVGRKMYAVNAVHNWVDRNLFQFIAPDTYAGLPRFKTWSNVAGAGSRNIYAEIGVAGRDGSGNQSGFTRKRPAWISSLSATSFADTAGNSTNTPAVNDVAYYTANGRKYKYNGGGSWSLQVYSQAQVRVLVGCGLPRIGDCYTHAEFWQELYDAIQKLRWTYVSRVAGLGFVMGSTPIGTSSRSGTYTSLISEADAKSGALALYTGSEPAGAGPIRVTSAIHHHIAATSPSWGAIIERVRAKFSVQGDVVASTAPLLSRSFDYFYIGGNYTPLDALGTGIDISGNLALWTSEGPTAAAKTESTNTFLDASVDPGWATIVTVNTAVEHDVDGGVVVDPYVVIRWDVAGGLPHL